MFIQLTKRLIHTIQATDNLVCIRSRFCADTYIQKHKKMSLKCSTKMDLYNAQSIRHLVFLHLPDQSIFMFQLRVALSVVWSSYIWTKSTMIRNVSYDKDNCCNVIKLTKRHFHIFWYYILVVRNRVFVLTHEQKHI